MANGCLTIWIFWKTYQILFYGNNIKICESAWCAQNMEFSFILDLLFAYVNYISEYSNYIANHSVCSFISIHTHHLT
jgi:hypothetical protein